MIDSEITKLIHDACLDALEKAMRFPGNKVVRITLDITNKTPAEIQEIKDYIGQNYPGLENKKLSPFDMAMVKKMLKSIYMRDDIDNPDILNEDNVQELYFEMRCRREPFELLAKQYNAIKAESKDEPISVDALQPLFAKQPVLPLTSTVPNIVNVIWVGSYPKEKTLKNTEKLAKLNPNYTVNLWVDSSFLTSDRFKELQRWALTNRVAVKDVNEIYANNQFNILFPLARELRNFELKRATSDEPWALESVQVNYHIPLSDQLRLFILSIDGGHYMDDDLIPDTSFPVDVSLPEGFGIYSPMDPESEFIASNCILSAVKNSDVLQTYIQLVSNGWQWLLKDPIAVVGIDVNVWEFRKFVGTISGPYMLGLVTGEKEEFDFVSICEQLKKEGFTSDTHPTFRLLCTNISLQGGNRTYRTETYRSPLSACVNVVNESRYDASHAEARMTPRFKN